jgi:tetratricopeptide (TPR) repeat protein
MPIDVAILWDFTDPRASEQRFRAAAESAAGDDLLILQTQIARTHGLRGDFDTARDVLAGIEPRIAGAGAEARARYWLELGRAWCSATHPPESQNDKTRAAARTAYLRAFEIARDGELDALAIDALHMMAFVDRQPEDQAQWARQALAIATTSAQPAARNWEASLRNNLGLALHEQGRHEEALYEFRRAVELRAHGTDAEATRIAWWMVAWTLRALGRFEEALDIQLRLEQEAEAAGRPDPYVFEELELLFRAVGDGERAARYAAKRSAPGG